MTVETQSNTVTYVGDGVATVFPFTFPVYDADHLQIFNYDTETGDIVQYVPANYSVSGVGNPNGGSVTLGGTAIPSTEKIIISRQVPLTQDLDLLNEGGFYPESLERELDLLQMQIQQIREEVRRSIRYPIGSTALGTLPAAPLRASKLLGFDPAGDLRLATTGELAKGDPGGNAMAIGLFADANTFAIDSGFNMVRTNGWSEEGEGVADYIYDAAIDAAYVVANPRTSFIETGGRGYKLIVERSLTVEQVGAKGDGLTDDFDAINTAIQLRRDEGGGVVFFAAKVYEVSDQLFWDDAPIRLIGSGTGDQDVGTVLHFPTGLNGAIRIKNGVGGRGAQSGVFHMTIKGSGITPVSDADARTGVGCGLLMQCNSGIIDTVWVREFEGNGVMFLSGPLLADPTINCNNSRADGVHCYFNLKNGFVTDGADSNNCFFGHVDASFSGQFGIFENSYLGNVYTVVHGSNNTTGEVRLGDVTRSNRFTLYKEIGTALVVLIDAGGGGRSHFDFRLVEGDFLGNVTFTDNSATGTNSWQNNIRVLSQLAVGADDPATGESKHVLDKDAHYIYKGGQFFIYNDDNSVQWHFQVEHGGDLNWSSPTGTNKVKLGNKFSADYGINVNAGVYTVGDAQVVGPRLPALPSDATDEASAVALVNAIKEGLQESTGHGLFSG